MKLKSTLAFMLLSIFSHSLTAQLFLDNSYSIDEMVMDFFDNTCVTPSNISTTGNEASIAFFDAGETDLEVSAGIFISTGVVFSAIGPNVSQGTGESMNLPGDPDLDNIIGVPTYDAVTIEMDIIATDSLLEFSYVFGSEEYPEFVGSAFNDVFAFFISGPGTNGFQNIAMIPGTTQAVAINNVNADTNPEYYVDNSTGEGIAFDGFTTEMIAQTFVIPNETYQVKIVVGDAADAVFDSGIFLGIESLCGEDSLVITNDQLVMLNGNTVTFENNTKYGSSYFWDFGDGTTSTEKNPEPYTYTEDGLYDITLITSNFCCSDTTVTPIQIGAVTSISELELRPYSINPNPIQDISNITFETSESFELKCFDTVGKLLFTQTGQSQFNLDLSNQNSGLYFIEIKIGNQVFIEKVIKL